MAVPAGQMLSGDLFSALWATAVALQFIQRSFPLMFPLRCFRTLQQYCALKVWPWGMNSRCMKKETHCASCVGHASHLNYSNDTWVSFTQNFISAQVLLMVSCNVLQYYPALLLLTILTHVKVGLEKTEEPGKCYTPFYIYIYILFVQMTGCPSTYVHFGVLYTYN